MVNNRIIVAPGSAVGAILGTYDIFGTATGAETVTVFDDTIVRLQSDFNRGGDTLRLRDVASDFRVVRQGSNVILTSVSDAITVTVPVGVAGIKVVFENSTGQLTDERLLLFNGTNVVLGSQIIGLSESQVATSLNVPPVVANVIPDRSVAEDTAWSYEVPANTFSDVDGNPLTYSASLSTGATLPSWLSFNTSTRTFSGTPPLNFNGNVDLRVTASDGVASVNDVFRLTVSPVNDAPVVSVPIADQTASAGASWTFTVPANTFSDVDGDNLVYTATLSGSSALPNWLTFNTTTRIFSGSPPLSGDFDLRVTASDGSTSANDVFRLAVGSSSANLNEFQVNTFSQGNELRIVTTAVASGNWLTAYNSQGGIYGQIITSAGRKVGPETLLSSSASSPDLFTLSNGNVVLSWTAGDESGSGVFYQLNTEEFQPIGVRQRANSVTVGDQTNLTNQPGNTIAELPNNEWVMVWQSQGQDGDGQGIFIRKFSQAGVPIGSDVQVNAGAAGNQTLPSVVALPDGRISVVWTTQPASGGTADVVGRVFDSNLSPVTGDFIINTTTAGDQQSAASTALTNGNWVTAWMGRTSSGDWDVYAQILDSQGRRIGSNFVVNDYTFSDQHGISLDKLSDGRWIISWSSAIQDGSDFGIYSRVFSSSGIALTGDVSVNTTTIGRQYGPSVAVNKNGDWFIGWNNVDSDVFGRMFLASTAGSSVRSEEFQVNTFSQGTELAVVTTALPSGGWLAAYGSQNAVYGQLIGSNGQKIGSETALSFNSSTGQVVGGQSPALLTLSNGNVVVSWTAGDDSGNGVYYQLVNESLNFVGTPLRANSFVTGEQSTVWNHPRNTMTQLSNGDWVMVWQSRGQDGDGDGIFMRKFSASGVAIGNDVEVNAGTVGNQIWPAVTALSNGRVAVVWTTEPSATAGREVFGRVFDSNLAPITGDFTVNTTTANEQQSAAITTLANGNWVVAWMGQSTQTGWDVYAQIFDRNGTKVGSEFVVNSFTASDQHSLTLDGLSDGRWVITWSSAGQDGSDFGIYSRVFSASGAPVTTEIPVNTFTAGRQIQPSVSVNKDNNWFIAWHSDEQDGFSSGVFGRMFQLSTIETTSFA